MHVDGLEIVTAAHTLVLKVLVGIVAVIEALHINW